MTTTSDPALEQLVRAADRLEALSRTGLLDSPAEEAFDRITRLTTSLLGVPVSLVSLVDADRQFFKSQVGLPDPWASRRETPLSHSFCQLIAGTGQPLVVGDARTDARVRDNLAVAELGVIAYLGVPLRMADGHVLGALCAIDGAPRDWVPQDIALLNDCAAIVMAEISRRDESGAIAGQLRESEQRLRLAMERQQLLMHEVGHRVKNSLQLVASLLAMQTRATVDPGVARALTDAETRIHAIAGVHDQLWRSGDFETIDLPDFINGLCRAVQDTAPRYTITFEQPAERIVVSSNLAVPAGLLVNELVTNAVKHAYADGTGAIRVALEHPAPDALRLTIADAGRGLPPGGDVAIAARGIGMRLTGGLVRQLHGTLRTEDAEPGCRHVLDMPLPAPRSDG